jgi:cytidylate kinase
MSSIRSNARPDADPNSGSGTGRESPQHGFQGDRAPAPPPSGIPASLTIAVSREAGSRGNTIGTRAGLKLGWPVYNQEMLDYVAQELAFRQNLLDNLPAGAGHWVDQQVAQLIAQQGLNQDPFVVDLARIVLSLGAQGEVVLIGRGAGCILPTRSTLNVRIVAPWHDRVAYISQWLRLPAEEAAEQVRIRDRCREDFLLTNFQHRPSELYRYDLILNSSRLGEDLCTELIVQAARAKIAATGEPRETATAWLSESQDAQGR